MATRGRKQIPIDMEMAEKYAALGMTDHQIAACLGICRTTLYKRKKENVEFMNAVQRGQAKGIQLVSAKCMEQINAGNPQLIKFYLEAKAGWETTTIIRAPDLDLSNMTADQIRATLANLPRQS